MTEPESDEALLHALANLVRQRRVELDLSQKVAAAAAGMSAVTWTVVEKHARPATPLTYGSVERALSWPQGAIQTFLEGGPAPEPVAAQDSRYAGPALMDASTDELLLELRRRLNQLADRGERTPARTRDYSRDDEAAEPVTPRGIIPGRPIGDPGGNTERAQEGRG